MRRFTLTSGLLSSALLAVAPQAAHAQRTLAHDTLSMETPSVVSCGFCGDEVIGVVFRELGGTAGLRPSDFPLALTNVQVALADANTDGVTCTPSMVGGSVTAAVEIWSGPTAPETLPGVGVTFGMPWYAEETLVWGSDAVPITLSTPTTEGGTSFNLQFNAFDLLDDAGNTIIVPEGNTYLRVAVLLPGGGGNNTVCVDPVEVPGGFPLRDNDGPLMGLNRSHIYGAGIGWLWNGAAGLNGDWAIRLSVSPMPVARDAGMRDAGAMMVDAGASDAGSDAGGTTPPPAGCACRATGSTSTPLSFLMLSLLGLAIAARRRRA